MTRLLVMKASPGNGFENFVGTYWVLIGDGKRLRHTTERQSEVTITLAKDHRWQDFFEEATRREVRVGDRRHACQDGEL